MPSYCSHKRTGIEADVFAYLVGTLKQGLTFPDRDNLLWGGKRQQFPKPPNPRKAERIVASRPLLLRIPRVFWELSAGPTRRRRQPDRRNKGKKNGSPRPKMSPRKLDSSIAEMPLAVKDGVSVSELGCCDICRAVPFRSPSTMKRPCVRSKRTGRRARISRAWLQNRPVWTVVPQLYLPVPATDKR